jgi:hypothetical protein
MNFLFMASLLVIGSFPSGYHISDANSAEDLEPVPLQPASPAKKNCQRLLFE